MRLQKLNLIIVISLLGSSGALRPQTPGEQKAPEKPPHGGFLYGRVLYQDMKEGTCRLARISVIRFEEDRVGERFWGAVLPVGYYYFRDLKPGTYQISSLSLSCKGPGIMNSFDDRKQNLYGVLIDREGVFFLGDREFSPNLRTGGFTLPFTRKNTSPDPAKRILRNLVAMADESLADLQQWLGLYLGSPASAPAS